MTYLTVNNWGTWQSYRKGRTLPPWIKLHRRLLQNPEWLALSEVSRAHLVSIWILAADRDGEVPHDASIIQLACGLHTLPDLELLIKAGFLCRQVGDKLAPTCRQLGTPESESESESESEKIPPIIPPQTGGFRVSTKPENLPLEITDQDWRDFEEMRRKMRKPMTDRARSNLASKLTRFDAAGYNAQDILNNSITNGWQDVYEPKDRKGNIQPPATPVIYFKADDLPERTPESPATRQLLDQFINSGIASEKPKPSEEERRQHLMEQAKAIAKAERGES